MRMLKPIAVLIVLFLSTSIFSSDTWTFNPRNHKLQVKGDYIYFTEKRSEEEVGPELYADDTNVEFFNLIQNIVRRANRRRKSIKLNYESYESVDNGTYNKIIPQN